MADHSEVCERVIQRAGGQCEVCGRPGAHIHHIVPRIRTSKRHPAPWLWLEQNLALVCERCDSPMLHTRPSQEYLINKFSVLYRSRGYDYTVDPWRGYLKVSGPGVLARAEP